MQTKAIELESPAYTTSNSRKYLRFQRTKLAYGLVKRKLVWEYQLWRGNSKFPRTKIMSDSEAINSNRVFAANFVANYEIDPERKLWEWRAIRADKFYSTRRILVDELEREDLLESEEAILDRILTYNSYQRWKS